MGPGGKEADEGVQPSPIHGCFPPFAFPSTWPCSGPRNTSCVQSQITPEHGLQSLHNSLHHLPAMLCTRSTTASPYSHHPFARSRLDQHILLAILAGPCGIIALQGWLSGWAPDQRCPGGTYAEGGHTFQPELLTITPTPPYLCSILHKISKPCELKCVSYRLDLPEVAVFPLIDTLASSCWLLLHTSLWCPSSTMS